jgi:hypothetical protein
LVHASGLHHTRTHRPVRCIHGGGAVATRCCSPFASRVDRYS